MATKTIKNSDGTFTTYDDTAYTPPAAQASGTIDSNSIAPTSPLTLPPAQQQPDYTASLSAIPGLPDPSAAAPTATEKTQTDLASRLESSYAKLAGKGAAQTAAETAAGLPGYQQQLTDVNGQIQALQKEALAIPLQIQQDAQGRGQTAAGVAPIQAAKQRENTIKALGLSAIAQTLQGNVALAQQQANKAVETEFAPAQAEIDYLSKALELNSAALTREDKKKADALQIQLQERQRLLDQQKENKNIIIGWAAEAAKNGASSFTINQALQMTEPQQALGVLANYFQDPNAKAQALATLDRTRAETALTNANAAKVRVETGQLTGANVAVNAATKPLLDAFNSAALGLTSAQMKSAQSTFNNLLQSGDTDGARKFVIRTALAGANATEQSQAIGRSQALTALSDIKSLLSQAAAKNIDTNLISGNLTNVAQKLGTTNNPDLTYIAGRITAELQTYRRAMTGVAFSPSETAQYAAIFPSISNTDKLNTAQIQSLTDALDSNNRATLGFYIGDNNYDKLFPNTSTAVLPSDKGASDANASFVSKAKAAGYSDAEIQAFLKNK